MIKKIAAVILVELCLFYAGSTWAMTSHRLHEAVTHSAGRVS
jgi:hypothetical protein